MLLGIDLGTSALKVMLFDTGSGRVAALEREPLEVRAPSSDRAEADPEDWWRALVAVLGRLRAADPAGMRRVRGIGLDTIFPVLVPMDGAGHALGPAILYNDRRSQAEVREIEEAYGRERFQARTGNRLVPGTSILPGLVWLRKHRPGVFGRARGFGQAGTFLLQRLTGRFVVDASQAGLSGMVASGRETVWDSELLDLAGVEPERLPRILPSIAPAGGVTAEAAAICGLPCGVPVSAGAGDAPAAAFGGGAAQAPAFFVCTGSTDCPMMVLEAPGRNPVFANTRFPVPEFWVSIASTSTTGAAVKWCAERVFHCTLDELTAWAESAPAGAEGVVMLPYLQGERTPWWDPRARGVFYGLGVHTGREALCRAVLEGVAFAWRQILGLIRDEFGFDPPEVTVVGGSVRNEFWNRIRASVLERPLRVLDFADTAALGAALAGGLAAGVFDSPRAACAAAAPLLSFHTVAPVPEWTRVYRDQAQVYDALYPALEGVFHDFPFAGNR